MHVTPSTATDPPGRGLSVITRPAPPPRPFAGAASRGGGAARPTGRGGTRTARARSTALAPVPSVSAKVLYLGLRNCDEFSVCRAVGVRFLRLGQSFFGLVDALELLRQWGLQYMMRSAKTDRWAITLGADFAR